MKLITRDTDYALRALSFIAEQDEKIVTVSELVKELKIPRPFLRKILQLLNKECILKSHRGSGGGFLLAKPTNKIFLVNLMEIFQGSFSLNECFLKKIPCPDKNSCVLREKIRGIEKHVAKELKAITIATLTR